MADYYLNTRNLAVGYQGKPLIRDISIEISKGDVVTLIGPNGAGKSTILKSIARQLETVAGTVSIDGRELHQMTYRELAMRMAVVLTERIRPELMTCRDIVETGRYPYTGNMGILSDADHRKAEEALQSVHAENFADRDFSAISDGQRQRILLARALCQEPEIIVLDEPTSFLDIRYKLELLSILRDMAKKRGITVIMSLHEIELAEKVSDRILCVSGETISHYGDPQEIFREDIINELYGIQNGSFDPLLGSTEMPRPEGSPEFFVISSSGRGIPVYRLLQKKGIPFSAGILYTNDLDFRVARVLASRVVSETPFRKISEDVYQKAVREMRQCRYTINAGFETGPENSRLTDLLSEAEKAGILKERDEL